MTGHRRQRESIIIAWRGVEAMGISGKPIKLLTLEILVNINEQIKILASKDPRIEYSGSADYPVKIHELEKLIEKTPNNRDIFEIAAYYLKNIILLQAFPDANHRTALTATERFLEKNNYRFDYT
ncbi:MAG: Fic family protein, partial [Candidatus Methanoperedens sp.]